jgi:hypothetical protein
MFVIRRYSCLLLPGLLLVAAAVGCATSDPELNPQPLPPGQTEGDRKGEATQAPPGYGVGDTGNGATDAGATPSEAGDDADGGDGGAE